MAYQTGTFANINDVLTGLKTFLAANGWTVNRWWRERIITATISGGIPVHDEYEYRFGVLLAVSKGTKHVIMQDFYITHDFLYGTNGGAFPKNGPGIAAVMSTAAPTDPWVFTDGSIQEASFFFPSYTGGATNASPLVTAPLPAVTHQDSGLKDPNDTGSSGTDDGILAAPFGPVSGPASPMPYWFFADATGDNWLAVFGHDNTTTLKTTFLGCGNIVKAGDWVGDGQYLMASHATANALTGQDAAGHAINRFGPPASIVDDGGASFVLNMPAVDGSAAGWFGIGAGTRRILSTAEMEVQVTGPLGTKTGFGYGSLRSRTASCMDGAPGLPAFLTIQRDSGLQSMIGTLPGVRQAHTFGFPMGTETQDKDGNSWVVFDGFMVRKVP